MSMKWSDERWTAFERMQKIIIMDRDRYNSQRPESYDKKGYGYKRLDESDKSEQTVKDRVSNCYHSAVGQIRKGCERLKRKEKKEEEKGRPEEKDWLLKEYNEIARRRYMESKEKEWWEDGKRQNDA